MFQFKHFSVEQDRCEMKVGTDGVLLGAWTPLINNPFSVLDIGAGTGLIALMLAQRSNASQIDALEIDENAYEQCVENFENSNWGDRLFCYHADFDEFVAEMQDEEEYDLIVSNPPFYSAEYKSENEKRDLARFEDALPFEDLIIGVTRLLSSKGVFSVIIPFSEEERFVALASKVNLFPFQITRIQGTPKTAIKRSLLAFSHVEKGCKTDTLIIENRRHDYTEDYKLLTRDFYLKF